MTKKNVVIIVLLLLLIMVIAAEIFQQIKWENKINTLSTQLHTLSTQFNQQQVQVLGLQNKISVLARNKNKTTTEQALYEIENLLDIANLYLQINKDVDNATKSLKLAQQHLLMVADPILLPLQQALASDLNRLNDAPKIDVTDVLLKLQTLSESISGLNINPQLPLTNQPVPTNHLTWTSLWENIKSLLSIRYQHQSSPILPPQQRDWIRENIAFTLSQAQWAVLQQKQVLYQNSLQLVRSWVTDYFPDNQERKTILQRIAELNAINISPAIPDINGSLVAVQKAIKQLPMQNLPSVLTPVNPQVTPKPETPEPQKLIPPQSSPGIEI